MLLHQKFKTEQNIITVKFMDLYKFCFFFGKRVRHVGFFYVIS